MEPRTKAGNAAFQFPDFRLFCVARLNSVFAQAMQNVAVGWFVFELSHSAFALGLTGLFTFLPAVLATPFTGHIADQFDRRAVVAISYACASCVAAGLFFYAISGFTAIWPIYCFVVVLGATKAFGNTALQALLPNLVPRDHFANAIAWTSSFQQFSNSAGPATGGLLYFFGAKVVFAASAAGFAIASASTAAIKTRPERSKREKMSLATLSAGLRFIGSRPIIFSSISLDMVAVCVGGVTALLPIFANSLGVNAWGLGLLRSAQAIGAFLVAALLAHWPVTRRSGMVLLISVAGYGLATIGFGLSTHVLTSIAFLVLVGGIDQVSAYIRATLVQSDTPDAMRGRVAAVNTIFIGASGSLGEFESGTLASFVGAVPAVVIGGCGAIFFRCPLGRLVSDSAPARCARHGSPGDGSGRRRLSRCRVRGNAADFVSDAEPCQTGRKVADGPSPEVPRGVRAPPQHARMGRMRRVATSLSIMMSLLATAAPAAADSVADFYRGKTITLNIGFSAGGGFDLYARTVARFMARHIPGAPQIVPQQMPGAGSFRAAQYMAAAAPQDGTQLATIAQSVPLEQTFHDPARQFRHAQIRLDRQSGERHQRGRDLERDRNPDARRCETTRGHDRIGRQ